MRRAALLLACCACLRAQPAAIEGLVVNQTTGEPMAGVHVRFLSAAALSSFSQGQPYGAMSDRAGHFSIASLPAGSYMPGAQLRGYFYMPPKGQGPAERVSLKAGQQLKDFRVEMAQGATITGRVLNEDAEPQPAIVRVESDSERGGDYRRFGNGDEHGEFKLSVAPGKYYIVAEPQGRARFQGPETRTDGTVDVIYGTTFYPGSAAKAKAAQVEVAAGAELTGIDIHLVRQPRGGSISGAITGPNDASGYGMVTMYDERRTGGISTIGVGPDGHFLFANLEAGTYRLLATRSSGKPNFYSLPETVTLDGNDVSGVNLVLQPAGELTGTVEMAGGLGTEKLSVALEPLRGGMPVRPPPSAVVDQTGVFRVTDVAPSRYRVHVTPLGENAYLKSVRLDGADEPDGEIDLSRGAQGSLKIVVSRSGGQISGKLVDKEGQPLGAEPVMVLLVADPKEIKLDRSLKMAEEDGTYIFQAIRPGKYRLLAIDRLQIAGENFMEALKKLAAGAEEIEIKEGEHRVEDLKVTAEGDASGKAR